MTGESHNHLPIIVDRSPKKIPNLEFATPKQLRTNIKPPKLTPITFVSKDRGMDADYLIESHDVEEINQSFKRSQKQLLQKEPSHIIQPIQQYMPFMSPQGMVALPQIMPSYAMGPDGKLYPIQPNPYQFMPNIAASGAFSKGMEHSQYYGPALQNIASMQYIDKQSESVPNEQSE